MAMCKDCVHVEVCRKHVEGLAAARGVRLSVKELDSVLECDDCKHFKDRSRFVELKSAEWIEDEDMYGDPIFRCSNCEARFVLEEGTPEDNEYYYCPTCGAKIQEQALKERENDTPEAAIIRLNQFRTDKDERDPAIDMAIRAINRVFVKRKPANDGYYSPFVCPECNAIVHENVHYFCPDCGQALDWS